MKEVCFILAGERVLRIDTGTKTRIPDHPSRWDTIWRERDRITEIAHTHPGGLLRFSGEDLTTMQAVEAAIGRPYRWTIVTHKGLLSRDGVDGDDLVRSDEPAWLADLRLRSFGAESATRNP